MLKYEYLKNWILLWTDINKFSQLKEPIYINVPAFIVMVLLTVFWSVKCVKPNLPNDKSRINFER